MDHFLYIGLNITRLLGTVLGTDTIHFFVIFRFLYFFWCKFLSQVRFFKIIQYETRISFTQVSAVEDVIIPVPRQ